ncbi:hypothetical protein Bca52824_056417 [Brassica carinata]|uniref:Uncharacterized protein n=1 Tax=Brassica carinata TaxID=52824 RepID=A0A8X7QPE6_BRACI|nr:hypothetical protein Bca52824_056417 [Brassica carinata]
MAASSTFSSSALLSNNRTPPLCCSVRPSISSSPMPRRRSVFLLNPSVDAMIASKTPAWVHAGLRRYDILRAQDLNFLFGSLHPLKETLKDRDFKYGGERF